MLVFNNEDKLFLGERAGEKGVWQFPQGGVDAGASIEENALREVHEELGIPLTSLCSIKQLSATHTYDFVEPPEYARGRWRGQTQTFWLVKFTGPQTQLDLGKFEREFDSFLWCTVEEVIELAEAKRLVGYRAALEEFQEFLRNKL